MLTLEAMFRVISGGNSKPHYFAGAPYMPRLSGDPKKEALSSSATPLETVEGHGQSDYVDTDAPVE